MNKFYYFSTLTLGDKFNTNFIKSERLPPKISGKGALLFTALTYRIVQKEASRLLSARTLATLKVLVLVRVEWVPRLQVTLVLAPHLTLALLLIVRPAALYSIPAALSFVLAPLG